MDEILKLDENGRNVLGAVTNDVAELIRNGRVNPITGALVCEADILSTNTQIGSTIPGGTAGSVLFLDIGSTLGEDNTRFFWDATNHRLGLLNNAPSTTLSIGASQQFKVNSTGNLTAVNGVTYSWPAVQGGASTVLTNNGSGTLTWSAFAGSGYTTIENSGVAVTQRSTINLSTLLTATDSGGKTALTINVTNLAGDSTFVTALVANNTFTTALAGDSNFYTTLANNNSFATALINNSFFTTTLAGDSNFISTLTSNSTFQVDIVTIINSDPTINIDLTSQVTGVLPVANGGTGASTFTDGGVLIGNTTGAIQVTTAGTAGQVLTSNGAGIDPTFQTLTGSVSYSAGVDLRAGADASGTQNIAHTLGTTPKKVKITARAGGDNAANKLAFSDGVYIPGTPISCCVFNTDFGEDTNSGSSSVNVIAVYDRGDFANGQTATITVDATNIIISWTKVGTGYDGGNINDNIYMMWEAEV